MTKISHSRFNFALGAVGIVAFTVATVYQWFSGNILGMVLSIASVALCGKIAAEGWPRR